MPWQPRPVMSIKQEFVELASREGANRRELCRRFGITPMATQIPPGMATSNSPT